ncbi:angiopoietin-related protein 7-like [Bactrocera neohumeralis]|uniref:angiopoietin-related protein 7-like n=1 Tax=Bactrocera neohumeralis TaxID=98809 RepID=UPI0021653ACC|nr:angiopoietin-related protein 7-like [Bactrocera neohumeralis]
MYKEITRYLCYLILTWHTVSVGRVKAGKDNDSEQPFTILLDAENEIRNVVNGLDSFSSKQDSMEETLKSVQTVMEKIEERLLELESTVKTVANIEEIVESFGKLLESRLGEIENKLSSTENIQQVNYAFIERRLDELGSNLKSTLSKQEVVRSGVGGVPDKSLADIPAEVNRCAKMASCKLKDAHNKTILSKPEVYSDCADAWQQRGPQFFTGIYEIKLPNFQPFEVFCMNECTTCCPWTLVMHGSAQSAEKIYQRSWLEYKHGFGSASTDYFIGLDRLHVLTKRAPQALMVRDYVIGNQNIFKEFSIKDERYDFAVDNLVKLMVQPWGYNDISDGTGDTFSSNSVCAKVRGRSWWYNQGCISSFGIDSFTENIFMAIRPKACQEDQ